MYTMIHGALKWVRAACARRGSASGWNLYRLAGKSLGGVFVGGVKSGWILLPLPASWVDRASWETPNRGPTDRSGGESSSPSGSNSWRMARPAEASVAVDVHLVRSAPEKGADCGLLGAPDASEFGRIKAALRRYGERVEVGVNSVWSQFRGIGK
jgi:hypothetical protein